MGRTKRIALAAAIVVVGSLGIAGVANASDSDHGVQDKAQSAKESASDKVADTKESASDKVDDSGVKDKAGDVSRAVKHAIKGML